MHRLDLTGAAGKGRKGQGPSAQWLLVLFFVPAAVLTQLSINSPYMLLAAAFPCWLWAEVPKITRRALHLWDSHCGGLKAACLLPAGPPVPLAPLLRLPVATPPQPPSGTSTFPFIALLRVNQDDRESIMGLEALPGIIWRPLSCHIPVGPAGTAESTGSLCQVCSFWVPKPDVPHAYRTHRCC